MALRLKLVMALSCKDEDSVIARAFARGNAAIKPRAESSLLELYRGGAGSTEGQSLSVIARRALLDVAISHRQR